MAFYHVTSLKNDIENHLMRYDRIRDEGGYINPLSRQMIELAYDHVLSAQEFSKRVLSSSCFEDALRNPIGDIIDAVGKLKDALDFHVENRRQGIHNIKKEIRLFDQTMHNLEEVYADDLYDFAHGEEVVSDSGDKAKMVGFSHHYNDLKDKLTDSPGFKIISLCGMPGIGKTTLAWNIFEDPDIVGHFDLRVWVRVGPKCRLEETLRCISAEVNPAEEDRDVFECLDECLQGKSCFIVLDDIWDRYATYCLEDGLYIGGRMRYPFAFETAEKTVRILIISRVQQINDMNMPQYDGKVVEMQLMNAEESWQLLRDKVFGEEWCPHHLETSGRKIAEKCEGLPLTIVKVAELLSREDRTAEYWNDVATHKKHQLFKDAYSEILKVLFPSFKCLPLSIQMCFMYVGVFPLYYNIPRSKLINLWIIDGFLEQNQNIMWDESARLCLEELVTNNMLMIKTTTNTNWISVGEKQIKTCRLHSSLWHLSIREARSAKFSHVLDCFEDGFGEDIKGQHRLSFHNNVLFAIKDLHTYVEDNCASTVHSLFCYGPYLQYQVPICFGLRLLDKLDALTIRLYEFPKEVLQLVELRYLALTLNGNLPAAISQLSKIEIFIVNPHQRIKFSKKSSYLPMEIWNMKKLQHLQVMGKNLPHPCGASSKTLRTLSRVSPNSCGRDILKAVPNLRKLGIEVELSHENDGELFNCFSYLYNIKRLESFKCVVVNPKSIPSFSPFSHFPSLKKLSLNGLGYAWEEMNKISIPSLEMLKLRNYAFQGPEWEVRKSQFPQLQSLVIEDTDLERWIIGHEILKLDFLIINVAYKLREVDGVFEILSYRPMKIEMVDCNPLGVEQIKNATKGGQVKVSYSWYD